MRQLIRSLSTFAVTFCILASAPSDATAQGSNGIRPIPAVALGASGFVRTELFFPTAKPDGTVVTDADFSAFLDAQITPRFPDGVTVLKGFGQFRAEDGVIIKEDAFVLILLYPLEDFLASSRRIDTIRTLYKAQFQQESVMRVDNPFAVWVSF